MVVRKSKFLAGYEIFWPNIFFVALVKTNRLMVLWAILIEKYIGSKNSDIRSKILICALMSPAEIFSRSRSRKVIGMNPEPDPNGDPAFYLFGRLNFCMILFPKFFLRSLQNLYSNNSKRSSPRSKVPVWQRLCVSAPL